MKINKMFYAIVVVINLIIILLYEGCHPVREFMSWKKYTGTAELQYNKTTLMPSKRNIIIVADNEGTEIFDLLAPYYLFNATGKANVIIVAQKIYPIILRKGLFIMPHMSFAEFDSARIKPDVLVIPNLSAMNAHQQNPEIVNWIKKQYQPAVKILSVCDGALTAAATGIYDGKFLTTHAADYARIKKQFTNPHWLKDVCVTQSGNLYSTAGVSNAVEGSLTVINDLFGKETMLSVQSKINYPHALLPVKHNSQEVELQQKICIGNKVFFKGNKRIGVLLQEDINEFELAAILDTYNRSFPKKLDSYALNNKGVTSMYGLVMLPTAALWPAKLDELHVLKNFTHSSDPFNSFELVTYGLPEQGYIINTCLERIERQYGKKFMETVKLLLDYN